jgi:hypothetical protein
MKFQHQCSMHFSESMNGWQLICTLCTAKFLWKCSVLFCEDSAYCLYKHYAQLSSGNVLGYSVKTVLTASTNTMEMFWVIPNRRSFSLYKHRVQLNSSANVLVYSVQRVFTACIIFWKCSGLFCEDSVYCLYKHYAQLRSGNVLGYSKQTEFQLV